MSSDKNNKVAEKCSEVSVGGSVPSRGSWDKPMEFVLSCIGYAVGLGNVWRFPYLCYRNGGGAFLVPYIIMLFIIGLPIFFLELVIGQYTGLGPIQAFERMAPIFNGLGYCTLVVITLVTIYYMVIVAWTIFYIFASFSKELKWGSCQNYFNSDACYSAIEEAKCTTEKPIFWKKICNSLEEFCSDHKMTSGISGCLNGTVEIPVEKVVKRVLASQEYYNDYVLGIQGATWSDWGYPRYQLLLCLLLGWMLAYFCVVKGVQSAGKAVYFTALFPYVVLFILLIRGCTLAGASEGIRFYIQPQWEILSQSAVWADAASQIFYAFGIGCGSLVTLSSYSSFTNNCHRDALIVSAANAFTSVFAGFAIFSVLGFLAQEMGVPVSEVADDGPGLAFVAYPEAVLRMPIPQLWAFLFFFMLLVLGLGSQLAGIEAINTAILDRWPQLRKHQSKVTLCTCIACYIAAIPMCCHGGVYLFTLMDWNTASWAILLIGIGEVGLVAWVYGCKRFLDNISTMQIHMYAWAKYYWFATWSILAPVLLFGVFVFSMYTYRPAKFADYDFPAGANALGWMISLSTLIPLPVFAIYRLIIKKPSGWALFKPSPQWGPAADMTSFPNSLSIDDDSHKIKPDILYI